MKISCEVNNLGHRYQGKFLFRNLSFVFEHGQLNMIEGNNGRGKSTLLKIIAKGMEAVEGDVIFKQNGLQLTEDEILRNVGLVGPYLELPEDLTLSELVDFQLITQPDIGKVEDYKRRISYFEMTDFQNRLIAQYSTGMKQKARLILSLTENRRIWILDEPGSNLDPESSQKLWDFVRKNLEGRFVVVASNDPIELEMASIKVAL